MSGSRILFDRGIYVTPKIYQERAAQTAIYPNRGSNLAYAAMGLAEEASEVLACEINLPKTPSRVENLTKEIGDVMWYVAACAHEVESSFEEVSELSLTSSTLEQITNHELYAQEMLLRASAICGRAKKVMRDDAGKITVAKRAQILSHLAVILALARFYAESIDTSLSDILAANIVKLEQRKSKGTLKGDSDNR